MRVLAIAIVITLWSTSFVGAIQITTSTLVVGERLSLTPASSNINTTVEFYLDRTGSEDGTPLTVANFQVRVELVGQNAGVDVRIVDVRETTSRTQVRMLDVANIANETTAFASTANYLSPFDVDDGAGLFSIDLEIQPSALGTYALQILTGANDLQLIDPVDFTTPFDVATSDGALIIEVPIPSSIVVWLIAMVTSGIVANRPLT